MKQWSVLDWIVLLLTILIVVTIGGSWIVGLLRETPLDDIRIKIVESIYNNVMGAILLFIGAKLQKREDDNRK